jgi:hypothetical protein
MSSAKRHRERANRFLAESTQVEVSRASRRGSSTNNPSGRRSEFLKIGSEALGRVYGTSGIYACPLCFANYTVGEEFDHFDAEHLKELTLEHVPTKRVGGREIMLTCRTCNNDFKPDGEAARFEDQRDYWQEVPGARSNNSIAVTHSGIQIRVQASIADEGLHEVVPVGPPAEVSEFECIAEREGGFVVAHPVVPFSAEVALSYLRSAYLAAFAKLGFSWVACKKVTPIRHLLNGRDSSGVDPLSIVLAQPGGSDRRLLFLRSPFRALVVQWDDVVVVLPFHETPDNHVEQLAGLVSDRRFADVEFDGTMTFPQTLELHWDFEHLKARGPFLGWSECDEHGHHANMVEACEVLAAQRNENLVRIEPAPFRAQRVFDGPEGLIIALSKDDYDKYAPVGANDQ